MMIKKLIPVAGCIAYPIAGAAGDWLIFLCSVSLMLFAIWVNYAAEFHGRVPTLPSYLYWISLYAFFLSILSYHTNLYVIFLLATIVAMWDHMKDIKMIGFLVLLTILISQSFGALIIYIPAVIVRLEWSNTKYHTFTHGLWHMLTAAGAYVIITTG